jgi:hypothetical protein
LRSCVISWSRRFDDPIPLPRGRRLVTLKDAADYIMKLSKAEQAKRHWQTAVRETWRATADEDGHYCCAMAL